MEDIDKQVKVDRSHLRCEDGVTLCLHLLRVLSAREGSGSGNLALHHTSLALASIGLLRERTRHQLLYLIEIDAHRGTRLAATRQTLRVGNVIRLILQRCQQAAYANTRRTQIGNLVNLEHGIHLARFLKDLLHLIGRDGIKAAAEAVELNEIEVLALRSHLRAGVQARVVHPLVNRANRALQLSQMGDGVLREHRQPKAIQQLGDGMVDLRVVVVRATCQHNAVRMRLLHPGQRLHALAAHITLEVLILFPSSIHRSVNLRARGQLPVLAQNARVVLAQLEMQTLLQLLLVVIRKPRIEEAFLRVMNLIDIETQRFRIAGHNGAIEVVACCHVLLTLPLRTRHPNEIGIFIQQVHDVAVGKLRRIAHAFGGHRLNARLVRCLRRRVRCDNAEAQLREEREPERVVLVHIESTRNTHRTALRLFDGKRRVIVEQALGLVIVEIRHVLRLIMRTRALLAAVTRDETTALARKLILAKVIHRKQTGIRASLTTHRLVRRRQRLNLLQRKDGGSATGSRSVSVTSK